MDSFSMTTPLLCLVFVLANSWLAEAGDPEITSDFLVSANVDPGTIDGSFFTFTRLRGVLGSSEVPRLRVSKATMAEFPALDGQSVSLAILQFPVGGIANPPRVHPRAAELLFVVKGSLEVGFVDTTNKLFTQTLQVNCLVCYKY